MIAPVDLSRHLRPSTLEACEACPGRAQACLRIASSVRGWADVQSRAADQGKQWHLGAQAAMRSLQAGASVDSVRQAWDAYTAHFEQACRWFPFTESGQIETFEGEYRADVEIQGTAMVGGFLLRGTPDVVLRSVDEVIVIDWKTGRYDVPPSCLQLMAYVLIAGLDNYQQTTYTAVANVRRQTFERFHVSRELRNATRKRIHNIYERAIGERAIGDPPMKPGPQFAPCRFCLARPACKACEAAGGVDSAIRRPYLRHIRRYGLTEEIEGTDTLYGTTQSELARLACA